MTNLLLKATPELLAGWCGPGCWGDQPVVILGLAQGEKLGARIICPRAVAPKPISIKFSTLYLDLSRSEVRDRVARVVASMLYDDGPFIMAAVVPGTRVLAPYPHYGMATTTALDGSRWRALEEERFPDLDATLDPNDDTRLPDGSRLVDAQALLAVAREVLDV